MKERIEKFCFNYFKNACYVEADMENFEVEIMLMDGKKHRYPTIQIINIMNEQNAFGE